MSKLTCMMVLSLGASSALAQSVAIDHYIAAPTGQDGFVLSRPTTLGHLRPSVALQIDYGMQPLVLQGPGGVAAKLVDNLLAGQLGLALGLFDRFVVYARLPVLFVLDGQVTPGYPSATGPGLGDLSLGARARLYGETRDPVSLAVELEASFPTAQAANATEQLAGESGLTFSPRLLSEFHPHPILRIQANLGGRFRQNAAFRQLGIDQEITFGVGAGLWIVEQLLEARVEFFGSTSFAHFGDSQLTPMEILGGARLTPVPGLTFGLAAGPGLGRGYGTPEFRGVFSVSWVGPSFEPGHSSAIDEEAEPQESFGPPGAAPTEGGVAGAPTAHEAVVDPYAAPALAGADAPVLPGAAPIPPLTTPPLPESPSPVPGARRPVLAAGYGEIDRDGDNIVDSQDHCPLDREDFDEILDSDGCPEDDADGDHLADADDRCPLTLGTQTDVSCAGCPANACMSGSGGAINIGERVEFEQGSDVIATRSEAVLRDVVSIMQGNLQIRRVRVEGHTDSVGDDAGNLELSRRRAASVRRWILARSIAPERIEAWGCGEVHPLQPNTTAEGRGANRRVEFLITDPPSAQTILAGCVSAE